MNLNTIEANVDYISRRIPKIINNARAALETQKANILKILKETNTNYEDFLQYKQEVSREFKRGNNLINRYWKSNRDIHNYRYLLDPLSLIAAANPEEAEKLLETYYSFDRNGFNDSENNLPLWKIEQNHYDNPFQKAFDLKSPTLITINICNMYNSYEKNYIPRMLVKTMFRDDIANFMNSNKAERILDDCCIGTWNNVGMVVNSEDELDKRKGYSEILLGQVSIHDLFDGIVHCYYDAFIRTISNYENLKTPQEQNRENVKKLIIDFIKKYQTIFDIPDYQFIKTESYADIDEKEFKEKIVKSLWMWKTELSKNFPSDWISVYELLDGNNKYSIYLFMEYLINGTTQVIELDEFGKQFKEILENNLNKALESYINRSVISMIFTYGAKCGLESYINPLEINQEFVKSLMNETFEDVAALNEGLKMEFYNGKDQIPTERPDDILSRRKIADLTRKRLFDYLMISFVAHNSNKKNYKLNDYFKDKNSNIINNTKIDKLYNGSGFYNFVHSCLQEIHAHQTVISNFQTNIIGFKNNNYIYKDTYELGSQFIKKYINDLKVKENIKETLLDFTNYYNDVEEDKKVFDLDKLLKEYCLLNPNTYNFNVLKNHRAFASLLKQLLKYILKLYYITGTYQEICKKEVLLKVPDYIRKNYLEIIENITRLVNKINQFRFSSVIWMGSKEKDRLQLNIWQGNDWKNISLFEESFWESTPYMHQYNIHLVQHRIAYLWWKLYKDKTTSKQSRYEYKDLDEICSLYYSNNLEDVSTTQEFFLDNDVCRYLTSFDSKEKLTINEPELFAINPSLVASREDINSIEEEVLNKNSYQFDYKKIVDNFKNYIDNKKPNELSIEELFTFSLLASSCEKTLNRQIASMESIQEFDKNNNEFEYLWIKSIDRYRLN